MFVIGKVLSPLLWVPMCQPKTVDLSNFNNLAREQCLTHTWTQREVEKEIEGTFGKPFPLDWMRSVVFEAGKVWTLLELLGKGVHRVVARAVLPGRCQLHHIHAPSIVGVLEMWFQSMNKLLNGLKQEMLSQLDRFKLRRFLRAAWHDLGGGDHDSWAAKCLWRSKFACVWAAHFGCDAN